MNHIIIDSHIFSFKYGMVDRWQLLKLLISQSGNTYDECDIKAKLEKINSNQYKVIKKICN